MWHRIWLSNRPIGTEYARKLARFTAVFMGDQGVGLRNIVRNVRTRYTLLWEVPKGRRNSAHEPNILCAVREFEEETGIKKSEYRILPDIRRRVNYISRGVQYNCIYYVAVASSGVAVHNIGLRDTGRPVLHEFHYSGEIGDICWASIEDIRHLSETRTLECMVAPAFRAIRNFMRI
jgi:8-oxo-dGTP pyrophosphatase MutT (NUDIX family)